MILSQYGAAHRSDSMMKTARIAGTPLELSLPESENMEDWAISSGNTVDLNLVEEGLSLVAYSIGAFMGDGYSRYNAMPLGKGSWYTTGVECMDRDIIERVQREFYIVSGKEYSIQTRLLKTGTRMYFVRAASKTVFDFYNWFTTVKQLVPDEFFRAADEAKRDFIAGLFDTDGSVKVTETWNGNRTAKNPRWQLGFSSTVKAVAEGVASLLRLLGVKPGSIKETARGPYRTIYTMQPNMRSFIDSGCYFHCGRKAKRIQDYLNHVVSSEAMYAASVITDEDMVQA